MCILSIENVLTSPKKTFGFDFWSHFECVFFTLIDPLCRCLLYLHGAPRSHFIMFSRLPRLTLSIIFSSVFSFHPRLKSVYLVILFGCCWMWKLVLPPCSFICSFLLSSPALRINTDITNLLT